MGILKGLVTLAMFVLAIAAHIGWWGFFILALLSFFNKKFKKLRDYFLLGGFVGMIGFYLLMLLYALCFRDF